MNRRNTTFPLPLLVMLLAAAGCGDPVETDTPGETGEYSFCPASVALELLTDSPEGDVPLAFTLAHEEREMAWVVLKHSFDGGDTWRESSVIGATTDLISSAEGERHTLTWQSNLDTDAELYEGLTLKLLAYSTCGVWPKAQLEGLTLDNRVSGDARCSIDMETPDDPSDGQVTVQYTVAHPESQAVAIDASYSSDGGTNFQDMEVLSVDCDGDGANDGLTGVSTSSGGSEHCLTWDSQEDFTTDQEVLLRLACSVGSTEHDSATSEAFMVENDPAPGDDDLIITELMPDAGLANGDYLELYNRTNHVLDLQGMVVKRWKSSDIGNSTPTSTFTVDHVAGTLTMDAGVHLLLAATYDEASNGCLDPDATWSSSFTLNDNSLIQFLYDGAIIVELDFTENVGFNFDEGQAMSLDPDRYDSSSWTRSTYWCDETDTIPACEETSSTAQGSPGAVSGACG